MTVGFEGIIIPKWARAGIEVRRKPVNTMRLKNNVILFIV
jgi:hypothetical protein